MTTEQQIEANRQNAQAFGGSRRSRTRRPVRHRWAALVRLSLHHRVELPVQSNKLGFSLAICR